MKQETNNQTTAHAPGAITRRRALILMPSAALALAAALSPAHTRRRAAARTSLDPKTHIPQDTLVHGAGWCIPH